MASREKQPIFDRLNNYQLLILDDLYAESSSDYMREISDNSDFGIMSKFTEPMVIAASSTTTTTGAITGVDTDPNAADGINLSHGYKAQDGLNIYHYIEISNDSEFDMFNKIGQEGYNNWQNYNYADNIAAYNGSYKVYDETEIPINVSNHEHFQPGVMLLEIQALVEYMTYDVPKRSMKENDYCYFFGDDNGTMTPEQLTADNYVSYYYDNTNNKFEKISGLGRFYIKDGKPTFIYPLQPLKAGCRYMIRNPAGLEPRLAVPISKGSGTVFAGTNVTLTYFYEDEEGIKYKTVGGPVLPSTGGYGTHIFVIIGAIIIIFSATLIIAKK